MSSMRCFATASTLLVALVACGGGSSATTSPSAKVPVELQGTWSAQMNGTGEQVRLTLDAAGTYQLVRAASQESGKIGVTGFEIFFHSSTACSGIGTYEWSVNVSLILTPIAIDLCPTRAEVLSKALYRRAS